MNRADVAIAGAGIIGLTTALDLAAAGCSVTVFDQNEAMSEASRAAAGMLAGDDPENPEELRELSRLSLTLYSEFLARVESLSGKSIPIRTTRTVLGVHHLPQRAKALSATELQAVAPDMNADGCQFFFLEEQSFDAWDLAEALPAAARSAGIELRERTAVLSVRGRTSDVELVTATGSFFAGVFLNATGAWAPRLDPALPVSPRKGHMLTVELPGEMQTQCVLRTPSVYIVPRGGNRYTVGSTVEDVGFDHNVDPLRSRNCSPEPWTCGHRCAKPILPKPGWDSVRDRKTVCPSSMRPAKTAGSPPAISRMASCSAREPGACSASG